MEKNQEKNKTLLDLSREAFDIEQEIIAAGGEINDLLETKMAEVRLNISNKVDAYEWRMNALLARAEQFKARAEDFTKVAKAMETYVKELKNRIKFAMLDLKTTELEGNDVRFKLSKAKDKLIIENDQALPKSFLMTVSQTLPDNEKIREALERKEAVPGAHLEESYSLRTYANRKK